MLKIPRFLLADLSLILVGLIWGLSFTVIKYALEIIPPMQFIGLRFIFAASALAIIFHKHLRGTNKEEIRAGCIIGIFLFLGFLTQTTGLQFTTPGKSGFITGIYIVIVPFLASLVQKKFIGYLPITGAIIAFTGLCMLSLTPNELYWLNKGDLLTVICAFCYAMHILTIEHYAKKHNPYVLCIMQIAFTGIMSMIYALVFEPATLSIPTYIWGAVVYTGLFATCLAFVIQNVAQKYTSSTHAALLLGLEAPFALLFSILLWGENPTLRGYFGCSLIFIAILIIELEPVWSNKSKSGRDELTVSK